MIERSPKIIVIQLTKEQKETAAALIAERDDCYKRFQEARQILDGLYQSIAGAKNDWELDESGTCVLVSKFGK